MKNLMRGKIELFVRVTEVAWKVKAGYTAFCVVLWVYLGVLCHHSFPTVPLIITKSHPH
jgi:hypothetical protein